MEIKVIFQNLPILVRQYDRYDRAQNEIFRNTLFSIPSLKC